MLRPFPSIIIIISFCLLAACAKPAPKVAKYPEGTRTKLAVSVEKDLARAREATHTMKGLAWVELDTESDDWQTEAAVVVSLPDRLRIDVMDSLADVWAQIGSDGRNMWLYVPGKRKLYKGRASSRNMRRLASFDFEPGNLVSLFAGLPPLPEDMDLVQVRDKAGRHLVDLKSGIHLWVGKGRKRTISRCVRYSKDGKSIDFEIDFSSYRRTSGVEYPHAMSAVFPQARARLKLEYKEVVLGGDVEEGIFAPPSRRRGRTVELSKK